MPEFDEHGRPETGPAADEVDTLLAFLDFQRATLAWKCSRLDASGLQAKIAASSITLAGLLKHLACVEDYWFSYWLHCNDQASPWDTLEWDAVFTSAADDSPEELRTLWEHAVHRSRTLIAEALATRGLDGLATRTSKIGKTPNLRWIIVHMIEEYARHNGHADLLRESVDGETGE